MDSQKANDRILMIDRNSHITGISDSAAALFSLRAEQIRGMNVLDLNFGLNLTQLLTYQEKARKDNQFQFKTFFTNPDGGIVNLEIQVVFMAGPDLFVWQMSPEASIKDNSQYLDPRRFYQSDKHLDGIFQLDELIDVALLEEIMDHFYQLTGIPVGIVDIYGKVLIKKGWQDICLNFHRVHPETCRNCVESDCEITRGIRINEYRGYKCKNNLWDIATPIYIANQQLGHIFLGQFFYDDEPIDFKFFRNQARKYGFTEAAYLKALKKVPRFSRQQVDLAMGFYAKMAEYISKLSYTNYKINETMDELYNVLNFQTELMNAVPSPIFYKDTELNYLGGNKAFETMAGFAAATDYVGKSVFETTPLIIADSFHQADLELLQNKIQQVYEMKLTIATGELKDVIINKDIFRNLAGEPAGIIGVVQDITDLKDAEERLISANQNIIETQKEIIYTLGQIIETRSQEAAKHVIRVAEYSYLMALEIGMSPEEADLLKIAAPMHDIGKIGIPDHILNKPGALTLEEFEIIKKHTTIGYDILKKSHHRILKMAATIALNHHERWDGNGYPAGISAKEIGIGARIVSIADVFDAISHKRCYKESWPLDQVETYLWEQRGLMFDPVLIDLFFDNWNRILQIREEHSDRS